MPDSLFAKDDLKDGVRARRVVVGARLAAGAHDVAVLDELQYVIHRVDDLLLQADHLHLLLAVLQHAQLVLAVK